MKHRFDFLVVGSGIAGLFYALRVSEKAPGARLAIVTKKGESVTSTNRAQGGIAAVLAETDSFEAHIEDTLRAGAGLCRRDIVEKVVEAGPRAIEDLIAYGVGFTQVNGKFDLGREGGHSRNRVVHASDLTGREIERALLLACRARDNISIFPDHMVLDLVTDSTGSRRRCAGGYVFSENDHTIDLFCAPVTMLATGGLGQVYFHTSNPKIATGDGIAMAYRAGVPVGNLEFIQFHPTTLYAPGRAPFLLSEALRGEGGRLKSVDGRYLMENTHELKDLAPRDVVARAIDKDLKATGEEYVLLQVNHLNSDFLKKRFPNIYKRCLQYGFDITKREVPVVPAAHYACGGIVSTINGETELPGLYAAGEVAMTGMHGANRLASNSLLEAVVMAAFASESSVAYFRGTDFPDSLSVEDRPSSTLPSPRERIIMAHDRRQLSRVMSDFVGILRTESRLLLALEKVQQTREAVEQRYKETFITYGVVELRAITTVAELIVRSALSRKESRGLHYLEEMPHTSDKSRTDTIIRIQDGEEID